MYIPDETQLDKARIKSSFSFVINARENNAAYTSFERFAVKKGILFTNCQGVYTRDDHLDAMVYWVKVVAPNIESVLEWAEGNPMIKTNIYL